MTLLHIPPAAADMQDAEFYLTPYLVISGFMCGLGAIVTIIEFLASIGWRQLRKYVLDGSLSDGLGRLLIAAGVGLAIGFYLFVHDMSELWKPMLKAWPKISMTI
jgi:hypothetical protein